MYKNNFNIKKYIEKIKKSIKKVTYLLRGNKFKISFLGIFTICVLILFISNSFAVEVPVETTSFTSSDINYDSGESGAWKITRTASWISKNKAKVVYDLKTNPSETSLPVDYILVVDGSLNEHDASFSAPLKTLLNNMHHYNNINNRVAVIGFNDKAEILTDFTNDETGTNTVLDNFLSTSAHANKEISYYAAFKALSEFMENYTSDGANIIKVIFVTDGKPVIDSPKEISLYQDLKEKYPELSVLGIQYSMGNEVVDAIKNVSDAQVVADKDNVWDVIPNIYLGYENDNYDSFVFDDYFKAPFTVDKVETTRGVATIDSEYSVEWNLNDSSQFVAGASARMTVYFNVSNEYTVGDIIPISDTTIVNYSFAGGEKQDSDTNSPTLATGFKVNYDSNAPSGCVVSNMPSSDVVGIYNIVRPTTVVPKCKGYLFKEWKLVTSNITTNNDDSFNMPYKEVTYKATWAKASLNKSAEGTIAEKATLYGVLRDEVSNGGVAKEYTGKHQDSVDGSGSSKIYYYTASNDTDGTTVLSKNNVVFAGMCWQMIRTTDTGDVRMIYNGEVDSNDGCGTDRKNHPNYSGIEEITLNAKHKYSTDYSYNKTLKKFKVAGDLVTVDTSNPSSLIGTYTCLNSHKAVSCSTLYQVLYVEDSKIYAAAIKSSDNYNSIGSSVFNNVYGYNSEMGYMYNDNYPGNTYEISNIEIKKEQIDFNAGTYCQAVTYNTSTKTYSCSGNNLRYFWEVGGDDFRKSLVHNYVVSDDNPSVVRYMIGINIDDNDMTNSYYYYIELTDGQIMDDFYVYGDGYTINDDGTYKITNPTLITKRDFYYSYSDYKGKYFGEDLQIKEGNYNSTSYDGYKNGGLINTNRVSSLFYNLSSGGSSLTTSNYQSYLAFSPISKIPKFSSSVTYSNGKYKLSGTVTNIGLYDTSNISKINNTHYTCFTAGDECSSVYYVYYANGNYVYSIKLNNGEDISKVLVNMFNSSATNSKDSTIKQLVESWYAHSLSNYTSYLADTVYCNDRSIKSLGGFDPNGGNLYLPLTFNGISSSLICSNEADRFSVSNSVAPLKYPVGLLSGAEANLLGNNKIRVTGSSYWLMSPASLAGYAIGQSIVKEDGSLSGALSANSGSYIRPVITLKGSLALAGGDGSIASPYVISTD